MSNVYITASGWLKEALGLRAVERLVHEGEVIDPVVEVDGMAAIADAEWEACDVCGAPQLDCDCPADPAYIRIALTATADALDERCCGTLECSCADCVELDRQADVAWEHYLAAKREHEAAERSGDLPF